MLVSKSTPDYVAGSTVSPDYCRSSAGGLTGGTLRTARRDAGDCGRTGGR